MPYPLLREGLVFDGKPRSVGYMVPDDCPTITSLRSIGAVGPYVEDGVTSTVITQTPEGQDDDVVSNRHIIVPVEGSPNWFWVAGPDGRVDEKKRRRKAAQALADELNG